MKNPRYCYLIILAVAMLFLFSGCAEGKITVTYVKESTPPASSNAQPSSSLSPSVSTKVELPPGTSVKEELTADLNNDGVEETITISCDPDEYITVLEVSGITETYKEIIEGCEYESFYIVHTPRGNVCLLLCLIDYVTYCSEIYSFNDIKPVEQGDLGHVTYVSGTEITVEGGIDALGTWHYTRMYKLSDDFSLDPYEDYQIKIDDYEPLCPIKKLPVELLIDGVYKKDYIAIGKNIFPMSTDGESYLKFKLEDDSVGRILFTKADSQDSYDDFDTVFLIDGKSEFEYFEDIHYTDMYY